MRETHNNLKIDISGVFAAQIRQLAQMMGVTHEVVIQMAIANFAASPIVANVPAMSISNTKNSTNSNALEPEIIHEDWVEGFGRAARLPENDWPHLRADHIDFDSIGVGTSTQPEHDYYLWGQFSRFLPIKYTLRVLAWLSEDSDGITLQNWASAVRSGAPKYRKMLRELDLELRTRRGSQMASGFPKDSEKSLNRFVDHFCANIYSNGKIVGMPAHLGLITSEGEIIKFTPEGLDYVKAINPIIDGVEQNSPSISSEEIRILLNCIHHHLPSEWDFMKQILSWIEGGNNTPDLLTDKIREMYGSGTERNWNDKQVPTYRGGMIGRLGELMLITRKWKFRSVTYRASAWTDKLSEVVNNE